MQSHAAMLCPAHWNTFFECTVQNWETFTTHELKTKTTTLFVLIGCFYASPDFVLHVFISMSGPSNDLCGIHRLRVLVLVVSALHLFEFSAMVLNPSSCWVTAFESDFYCISSSYLLNARSLEILPSYQWDMNTVNGSYFRCSVKKLMHKFYIL